MLNRIVHWKKIKWILIVFIFIILLVAISIYSIYRTRKKYDEQVVMAQKYLEAGSFENAIESYQKAMSMKYGDKEFLSIGLAEAYSEIHNYDKALEVLRSIYEAQKTTAVKEKIEEITARKTDYGFYQLISFGDTYYSNGEYNKAIDEYEKAKQVKSRSDIPYLKIVESYMAMEKYDLAKEEIQDGLALTESEKLNEMMNKVEASLKDVKYNEILESASEYVFQENYEEAFKKYNEAIWLIPGRDTAYNQMAGLYITMKDYDSAKALLQNYLRSNHSDASSELLNEANELIAQRREKERVLNELYAALSVADIEAVINTMEDSFFVDVIAEAAPLYYSPSGNMNLMMGYGIMISDKSNVYAGGFKDKMKEGIGIQFVLNDDEKNYKWYYYQGEWNLDMPNGMGKTGEEILERDGNGSWHRKITETSGEFVYGLESGTMYKTFYEGDEEKGKVYYLARDGVPVTYLDENGQELPAKRPDEYVIGEIYLNNEPTGEYYSIKQGTKFAVKFKK